MKRIAIFASGTGTNAREIIRYFKNNPSIEVSLVVSNNPSAGVLNIAKENNIETLIIDREGFFKTDKILNIFHEKHIDFIVLAGFLWLIPGYLVNKFENKIINIHPSLLPKYGGKGMYGGKVHEAVINNMEKQSGITIHYVNEYFDEGKIIFQATCEVLPNDTPDSLAQRIHKLEHQHFPKTIEKVIYGI